MELKYFDIDYDYNREYYCSIKTKCKHFSKLMYYIINVNNIPNGKEIIKKYIEENKDKINDKNEVGWTVLKNICKCMHLHIFSNVFATQKFSSRSEEKPRKNIENVCLRIHLHIFLESRITYCCNK